MKISSRIIATLLAFSFLAGCETAEQVEARERVNDRQTCLEFGFKEKTKDFSNCLLQSALHRKEAMEENKRNAAVLMQQGALLMDRSSRPYTIPQPQMPFVNTRCNRFGDTVNCTSW